MQQSHYFSLESGHGLATHVGDGHGHLVSVEVHHAGKFVLVGRRGRCLCCAFI